MYRELLLILTRSKFGFCVEWFDALRIFCRFIIVGLFTAVGLLEYFGPEFYGCRPVAR